MSLFVPLGEFIFSLWLVIVFSHTHTHTGLSTHTETFTHATNLMRCQSSGSAALHGALWSQGCLAQGRTDGNLEVNGLLFGPQVKSLRPELLLPSDVTTPVHYSAPKTPQVSHLIPQRFYSEMFDAIGALLPGKQCSVCAYMCMSLCLCVSSIGYFRGQISDWGSVNWGRLVQLD